MTLHHSPQRSPDEVSTSVDTSDTPTEDFARLKAREHFFNLMSHEIRTPLNGVLGMLSLLKRTPLSPEQSAYLDTARQSGDHLLGLVNSLLDYARMEAGHIDLEITPVALEPLLQGVAELLSPRAFENGIDIVWSLDPRLTHVHADEGRLRQILFNLAGNAVKFTHAGGVHIHAGLSDEGFVKISVSDTGPGIPKEAQTRIFEAFSQVDRRHASQYGGAGLGLLVVSKLCEAMKATITLDSDPGRGSTFHVSLPAPYRRITHATEATHNPIQFFSQNAVLTQGARSHLSAIGYHIEPVETLKRAQNSVTPLLADRRAFEKGPVKAPHSKCLVLLAPEERDEIPKWRALGWSGYLIKPLRRASVKSRLEALCGVESASLQEPDADRIHTILSLKGRVLLVEDNPVNAMLAQVLLQREGCDVERAPSGEDALEILKRSAFDLVLMDLGLPGLDGISTTRMIRASGNKTPIIALTANAYEEDRRACLNVGMNDFLTKPIEIDALRKQLARFVVSETAINES